MEDFIMDNVLETLIGMVATKPINITVNVYNRPDATPVASLLTTLDGDDCDGECDLCGCCCDDVAEDFDEVIDCDDCEEAKYAQIWETFKGIIVQQMPGGEQKLELLKLMSYLENTILG
jgi:hypothetical protein